MRQGCGLLGGHRLIVGAEVLEVQVGGAVEVVVDEGRRRSQVEARHRFGSKEEEGNKHKLASSGDNKRKEKKVRNQTKKTKVDDDD